MHGRKRIWSTESRSRADNVTVRGHCTHGGSPFIRTPIEGHHKEDTFATKLSRSSDTSKKSSGPHSAGVLRAPKNFIDLQGETTSTGCSATRETTSKSTERSVVKQPKPSPYAVTSGATTVSHNQGSLKLEAGAIVPWEDLQRRMAPLASLQPAEKGLLYTNNLLSRVAETASLLTSGKNRASQEAQGVRKSPTRSSKVRDIIRQMNRQLHSSVVTPQEFKCPAYAPPAAWPPTQTDVGEIIRDEIEHPQSIHYTSPNSAAEERFAHDVTVMPTITRGSIRNKLHPGTFLSAADNSRGTAAKPRKRGKSMLDLFKHDRPSLAWPDNERDNDGTPTRHSMINDIGGIENYSSFSMQRTSTDDYFNSLKTNKKETIFWSTKPSENKRSRQQEQKETSKEPRNVGNPLHRSPALMNEAITAKLPTDVPGTKKHNTVIPDLCVFGEGSLRLGDSVSVHCGKPSTYRNITEAKESQVVHGSPLAPESPERTENTTRLLSDESPEKRATQNIAEKMPGVPPNQNNSETSELQGPARQSIQDEALTIDELAEYMKLAKDLKVRRGSCFPPGGLKPERTVTAASSRRKPTVTMEAKIELHGKGHVTMTFDANAEDEAEADETNVFEPPSIASVLQTPKRASMDVKYGSVPPSTPFPEDMKRKSVDFGHVGDHKSLTYEPLEPPCTVSHTVARLGHTKDQVSPSSPSKDSMYFSTQEPSGGAPKDVSPTSETKTCVATDLAASPLKSAMKHTQKEQASESFSAASLPPEVVPVSPVLVPIHPSLPLEMEATKKYYPAEQSPAAADISGSVPSAVSQSLADAQPETSLNIKEPRTGPEDLILPVQPQPEVEHTETTHASQKTSEPSPPSGKEQPEYSRLKEDVQTLKSELLSSYQVLKVDVKRDEETIPPPTPEMKDLVADTVSHTRELTGEKLDTQEIKAGDAAAVRDLHTPVKQILGSVSPMTSSSPIRHDQLTAMTGLIVTSTSTVRRLYEEKVPSTKSQTDKKHDRNEKRDATIDRRKPGAVTSDVHGAQDYLAPGAPASFETVAEPVATSASIASPPTSVVSATQPSLSDERPTLLTREKSEDMPVAEHMVAVESEPHVKTGEKSATEPQEKQRTEAAEEALSATAPPDMQGEVHGKAPSTMMSVGKISEPASQEKADEDLPASRAESSEGTIQPYIEKNIIESPVPAASAASRAEYSEGTIQPYTEKNIIESPLPAASAASKAEYSEGTIQPYIEKNIIESPLPAVPEAFRAEYSEGTMQPYIEKDIVESQLPAVPAELVPSDDQHLHQEHAELGEAHAGVTSTGVTVSKQDNLEEELTVQSTPQHGEVAPLNAQPVEGDQGIQKHDVPEPYASVEQITLGPLPTETPTAQGPHVVEKEDGNKLERTQDKLQELPEKISDETLTQIVVQQPSAEYALPAERPAPTQQVSSGDQDVQRREHAQPQEARAEEASTSAAISKEDNLEKALAVQPAAKHDEEPSRNAKPAQGDQSIEKHDVAMRAEETIQRSPSTDAEEAAHEPDVVVREHNEPEQTQEKLQQLPVKTSDETLTHTVTLKESSEDREVKPDTSSLPVVHEEDALSHETAEAPSTVMEELERVRALLDFEVALSNQRRSVVPRAEEFLQVLTPPNDKKEVHEQSAVPGDASELKPGGKAEPTVDVDDDANALQASDFNEGPIADWELELHQLRISRLQTSPSEVQQAQPVAEPLTPSPIASTSSAELKSDEQGVRKARGGPQRLTSFAPAYDSSLVILHENDILSLSTSAYDILIQCEREIIQHLPDAAAASEMLVSTERTAGAPQIDGEAARQQVPSSENATLPSPKEDVCKRIVPDAHVIAKPRVGEAQGDKVQEKIREPEGGTPVEAGNEEHAPDVTVSRTPVGADVKRMATEVPVAPKEPTVADKTQYEATDIKGASTEEQVGDDRRRGSAPGEKEHEGHPQTAPAGYAPVNFGDQLTHTREATGPREAEASGALVEITPTEIALREESPQAMVARDVPDACVEAQDLQLEEKRMPETIEYTGSIPVQKESAKPETKVPTTGEPDLVGARPDSGTKHDEGDETASVIPHKPAKQVPDESGISPEGEEEQEEATKAARKASPGPLPAETRVTESDDIVRKPTAEKTHYKQLPSIEEAEEQQSVEAEKEAVSKTPEDAVVHPDKETAGGLEGKISVDDSELAATERIEPDSNVTEEAPCNVEAERRAFSQDSWETELRQLRNSRLQYSPHEAEQLKAGPEALPVSHIPTRAGDEQLNETVITTVVEGGGPRQGAPGPQRFTSFSPTVTSDDSVVIVYERDILNFLTSDYEIRIHSEREVKERFRDIRVSKQPLSSEATREIVTSQVQPPEEIATKDVSAPKETRKDVFKELVPSQFLPASPGVGPEPKLQTAPHEPILGTEDSEKKPALEDVSVTESATKLPLTDTRLPPQQHETKDSRATPEKESRKTPVAETVAPLKEAKGHTADIGEEKAGSVPEGKADNVDDKPVLPEEQSALPRIESTEDQIAGAVASGETRIIAVKTNEIIERTNTEVALPEPSQVALMEEFPDVTKALEVVSANEKHILQDEAVVKSEAIPVQEGPEPPETEAKAEPVGESDLHEDRISANETVPGSVPLIAASSSGLPVEYSEAPVAEVGSREISTEDEKRVQAPLDTQPEDYASLKKVITLEELKEIETKLLQTCTLNNALFTEMPCTEERDVKAISLIEPYEERQISEETRGETAYEPATSALLEEPELVKQEPYGQLDHIESYMADLLEGGIVLPEATLTGLSSASVKSPLHDDLQTAVVEYVSHDISTEDEKHVQARLDTQPENTLLAEMERPSMPYTPGAKPASLGEPAGEALVPRETRDVTASEPAASAVIDESELARNALDSHGQLDLIESYMVDLLAGGTVLHYETLSGPSPVHDEPSIAGAEIPCQDSSVFLVAAPVESLPARPSTRTADTQTEVSATPSGVSIETCVHSKDLREASTYAYLSEDTDDGRRVPDDYLPLYLHRVTLNDKPSIADMIQKMTPCSEEWEETIPLNWKVNPAKDLEKWPSPCVQDVRSPSLLILGGINLTALDQVLTGCVILRYNFEENEWRRCSMMPLPRYGHRCVFMNGEIYIIGGFDNRDANYGLRISTSFCFRYNARSGEWSVVAPLKHARGYHGVTVVNGRIYAVGGVDANDMLLSSVEWYNHDDNSWTVLDKGLYCGRMGMGVTAFQNNLWVVGGIVQITGQQTCSTAYVEVYNPATNQWTYAASYLPSPRTCVSLLNVNDTELYCFGGIFYNSAGATRKLLTIDDILAYTDGKKAWKQVASMPAPRHNAHIIQHNGETFVVGGQDVEKPDHPVTNVSAMELSSNKFQWKRLKDIPLPISAYGAVIVPPLEG
ncbi:titin homolog [Ornithodoros turicata]|uniref:titin homolog n=1 Tax=Ornithodoros turicata TaxID=34597 RepID=UPI00313A3BE3